jgi:hypothetical protein
MKQLLEIITKILELLLNRSNRAKKKEQNKKRSALNAEIDELQEKYEKALREGDVSNITYYRNLLDRRMHNS